MSPIVLSQGASFMFYPRL